MVSSTEPDHAILVHAEQSISNRREFLRASLLGGAALTFGSTACSQFKDDPAVDPAAGPFASQAKSPRHPRYYCGVGIENGWMAQHDQSGERLLDVYLQMDHYARWEADLHLAAELGINAIRYSVPWYKSNPSPGRYDWDWIARPIDWLCRHDIIPIIDLIHYGTPLWMPAGIGELGFPEGFAEYAAAFAERFKGQVDHYTICNEPQTSVMFSGSRGTWPPNLKGLEGWYKLNLPVAKAMVLASRNIREVLNGKVTLISAECFWPPSPDDILKATGIHPLQQEGDDVLLDYMPASLAYGKIRPESAIAQALVKLGTPATEFDWFLQNAQMPDIFGFNFYPYGWPEKMNDVQAKADSCIRRCRKVSATFGLPIYITETSGGLTTEQKIIWIQQVRRIIADLRQSQVPIVGVNWWPLFDTIQWFYRENGRSVEDCIVPGGWNNGLYVIDKSTPGQLTRVKTDAANEYRKLVTDLLETNP
jgi:hypothetical protein